MGRDAFALTKRRFSASECSEVMTSAMATAEVGLDSATSCENSEEARRGVPGCVRSVWRRGGQRGEPGGAKGGSGFVNAFTRQERG